MKTNQAFVTKNDIEKVRRLEKYGFVLREKTHKGGYIVTVVKDPRDGV